MTESIQFEVGFRYNQIQWVAYVKSIQLGNSFLSDIQYMPFGFPDLSGFVRIEGLRSKEEKMIWKQRQIKSYDVTLRHDFIFQLGQAIQSLLPAPSQTVSSVISREKKTDNRL